MACPPDGETHQLRVSFAQFAARSDVESESETGELVDFMDCPVIDFGRDSAEEIRQKLLQLQQRQVYGAMRGER